MTPVVVPQARERVRPLSIAVVVCALVCVAVLPALLFSGYSLDVVTEIMIFAIAALSLNLILGYGGMVSFGHAALFGLSAYATVIVSMRFEVSPWIGLACGVLASTIAAAAIGAFCVRLGGVGFFMMSLAFAQLLNSAAVKWRPVTGGSDGVGGLLRPFLFGFDLTEPTAMYVFTLMSLLAALLATWRIITSPFGHALVGTRESSHRMSAIGYDTQRIRLVGFVLSGALAGLSGGLYAFFNGFVSPDALSFGMSGMILLMVVLGGKGSLVGPVVGAALFLLVKNVVSSHTSHWLLIVGSIFVACVMFCPDGIMGLLRRRPPPETR
jgi:branched-chain amino acid transport system permease protein